MKLLFIAVLRYVDPCPGLPCRARRPCSAKCRPKFISVAAWRVRFQECSTSSTRFNLCEKCCNHHLSRKLVARVADLFPESSHVVFHGLDQASDIDIWTFARANGYTIVTRDNDFNDLSTLVGAPPKIIWLRIGDSTTARVEQVLRHMPHSSQLSSITRLTLSSKSFSQREVCIRL